MKRMMITAMVLALSVAASLASANEPAAQEIRRASRQSPIPAPAEHFTGNVSVERLFSPDSDIPGAAYVTFSPGARSAWHSHPAGQRLMVIDGVGLTQQLGQPVQEIRPGDVVICPPGVKHWHGATPGRSMKHLAISGVRDGNTVTWMENVSDVQYNSR